LTLLFSIATAYSSVIEDSVSGVTAAVRAGMKVYGYTALTPGESQQEPGAIPFDNMIELATVLGDPKKAKTCANFK
jgi:beta-phosphoglucomutase-like phosphatase (HAD superfamily)